MQYMTLHGYVLVKLCQGASTLRILKQEIEKIQRRFTIIRSCAFNCTSITIQGEILSTKYAFTLYGYTNSYPH